MGFFSWKTSDTHESISNKYSNRGALSVYLYCPDGNKLYETDYEGYGKFGGHDAYALLAQWNIPEKCLGDEEKDRKLGIQIAFYEKDKMKYPLKFAESDKFTYEELDPAEVCKFQGYFYNEKAY